MLQPPEDASTLEWRKRSGEPDVRPQHLEGHAPSGGLLLGLVDDPHAAAPEHAGDAVGADAFGEPLVGSGLQHPQPLEHVQPLVHGLGVFGVLGEHARDALCAALLERRQALRDQRLDPELALVGRVGGGGGQLQPGPRADATSTSSKSEGSFTTTPRV